MMRRILLLEDHPAQRKEIEAVIASLEEQTEVLLMRHFKKTISWLSEQSFVPEVIRRLLTRALRGEDLEQTLSRVQPERKQEKQYQASL